MIMACLINLSMFSSYKMCCYLYFVRLCLQVVQKKYQEKSGTGGSLGEIKSYGLQMSSSTLTQHLKHIHNVNASETGTKESQPQIVTYMKNLSEFAPAGIPYEVKEILSRGVQWTCYHLVSLQSQVWNISLKKFPQHAAPFSYYIE